MLFEPQSVLSAGAEVLGELMHAHGFGWISTDHGRSSGGLFASGEFRRHCRSLELHLRYSPGLVAYHVGPLVLSHEDYMWSVIGRRLASEYPGFSAEPIDGFRHLLADLKRYCIDFLAGSDTAFARHVERAKSLKTTASRLP